jgi:CRISPR-associated protein Cmr5
MATTLEQQRAAFAWKSSEGVMVRAKDKEMDKYAKLAKSVPALIMTSGLMQTLAFLRDKNESHHVALLSHITLWLGDRFDKEKTVDPQYPFPARGQESFELLMQALFFAKPAQFQRATTETLALLRWVRQMSAALKEGE